MRKKHPNFKLKRGKKISRCTRSFLGVIAAISLSACLPEPKTNPAASQSGSFYVDRIETSFSETLLHASPPIPRARVLSVKACLKSNRHSNATLSNQEFQVVTGEGIKQAISDSAGCIVWEEALEFNYLAPARFVEITREIRAQGWETGVALAEITANPWTTHPKLMPTRNARVRNSVRQRAGFNPFQDQSNYRPIFSARFGQIQYNSVETFVISFSGELAVQTYDENGQEVITPITSGNFQVQARFVNRRRGAQSSEMVAISGWSSPAPLERINGQYSIRLSSPINGISCAYDQVLVGLRITPVNASIPFETFEGVFSGPPCDQQVGGFLMSPEAEFFQIAARTGKPLRVDDYFSKAVPWESRPQNELFGLGVFVEQIRFDTQNYQGSTRNERHRNFVLSTRIRSVLGHTNFRNQRFFVTKMNGTTETILSNADGEIRWNDSLSYDYFGPECLFIQPIRIRNDQLGLDQEIPLIVNPWAEYDGPMQDLRIILSGGEIDIPVDPMHLRGNRPPDRNWSLRNIYDFVKSQGQRGKFCAYNAARSWGENGERLSPIPLKSRLKIDTFRFNRTDSLEYGFKTDKFLDTKLELSGKNGFTVKVQRPLLSQENEFSEIDIPNGPVLVRIALVDRTALTFNDYKLFEELLGEHRIDGEQNLPPDWNERAQTIRGIFRGVSEGNIEGFRRLFLNKIHFYRESIEILSQNNTFDRATLLTVGVNLKEVSNRQLFFLEVMPIKDNHRDIIRRHKDSTQDHSLPIHQLLVSPDLMWTTFVGKITLSDQDPASNLSILSLREPSERSFLDLLGEVYREQQHFQNQQKSNLARAEKLAEFLGLDFFPLSLGASGWQEQQRSKGMINANGESEHAHKKMRVLLEPEAFSFDSLNAVFKGELGALAARKPIQIRALCDYFTRGLLLSKLKSLVGENNPSVQALINPLSRPNRYCTGIAISRPFDIFDVKFHYFPTDVRNMSSPGALSSSALNRSLTNLGFFGVFGNSRDISIGVGVSVSRSFGEAYSQSAGVGVDLSFRHLSANWWSSLTKNQADFGFLNLDGGFKVNVSATEATNESTARNLSTGIGLRLDTVSLPLEISGYRKCMSLRLNPNLFQPNRGWEGSNLSLSAWIRYLTGYYQVLRSALPRNLGQEALTEISRLGILVCDEPRHLDRPIQIRENIYVVNQPSNQAVIADGEGGWSRPFYQQLRGDEELLMFLSLVNQNIEQIPETFRTLYAAHNLVSDPFRNLFLRMTPSFPGVITRSQPRLEP